MTKDRKTTIIYISIIVLIGGLWIASVVLEYLVDSHQNGQIQELRSRVEKIEAGREIQTDEEIPQ